MADIKISIDQNNKPEVSISNGIEYEKINVINGKDGKDGYTPIKGIDYVDGIDGKDGKSIEYNWKGTSLGIRQEGEKDYDYVDLKAKDAHGTDDTIIDRNVIYYDSIEKMKSDISLKEGNKCFTLSYKFINDGGGSCYHVRKKSNSDIEDNAMIIFLQNDLVAEICIQGNRIYMQQLGYFPNDDKQDCKDSIKKYVDICNKNKKKYELFFDAGCWYFSETDVNNGRKGVILTGVSPQVATDSKEGESCICPFNENQEYIWNFGKSVNSSEIVGGNVVKNFNITTRKKRFCKIGILLNYCCYSFFDGLYFHYFRGTGLAIQVGWENYFGFMNFRIVGYYSKEFTYPAIWIRKHPVKSVASAVSANYINYINFEGIAGCAIYADYQCDFVHCEINNIQMEWSTVYQVEDGVKLEDVSPNEVSWDDESENIEHVYVVKGNITSIFNPVIFNTLSISSASVGLKKMTYKDKDNKTVIRYIRKSGIFGNEEHYKKRYELFCIVGKLSISGTLPAYHSVDMNGLRGGIVIGEFITTSTAKENPFLINNAGTFNRFEIANKGSYNYSNGVFKRNRIYIGNQQGRVRMSLSSLGDGSGINGLVGRGRGITDIIVMKMDCSKLYTARIYLKAKSADEFPDLISLGSGISIYDENGDEKDIGGYLWLKISKSQIEDGTYPLNTWFNYDILLNHILPINECKAIYSFSPSQLYIDYIEESKTKKNVTYAMLKLYSVSKYSKIGSTIFCTDIKENEDDKFGLMVYFDGEDWRTFTGKNIDSLIKKR